MSLEVIDFTSRKKIYKLEAGEFTLKPPYMNIVNKAKKLLDKVRNISVPEDDGADETKEYKLLMGLQLDILKLLLEETEKGKFENLKVDQLRQDIVQAVMNDFFSQYNK
jgi:hypothetical protein